MTVKYHTELPTKVRKLELARKEWAFNISLAIACTREVTVDEDGEEQISYIDRSPKTTLASLTTVSGVPIVPGLLMVTGSTGLGKTQATIDLVEKLVDQLSVGWITLNEPALLSDAVNTAADVARILFQQEELPDVIVIDSFRLLQFSVAGTTRSGGVSSGLFEMLTELNNAAEQQGILLIGLFNPLASDADTAARFDSEIESSVQTVLKLTSRTTATVVSRATGRKRVDVNLETAEVSKGSAQSHMAVTITASPTKSPLDLFTQLYSK